MPREAEISINEREFIKQALQEQIRLDGRAFDAFRPLELTFGDEYGVADVQLGKTRFVEPTSIYLNCQTDLCQGHCPYLSRCSYSSTGAQVRRRLPDRHRVLAHGRTFVRNRATNRR